jgi:DNA-binding MarR family transcriptional regulator
VGLARRAPAAACPGVLEAEILRFVARFGAAGVRQLARHTRRGEDAVQRALEDLVREGLVRTVPLPGDGPETACATLTPAGRRHLPPTVACRQAPRQELTTLLAAVELAADLAEREGAGWLTWQEACQRGWVQPAPAGARPPAEGVVVPPPAGGAASACPACIILRRVARRAVRARLEAASRLAGGATVRVFVPPHLWPEVARGAQGLPAVVEAWSPWPGTAAPTPPGRRRQLTAKRLRVLQLLGTFGYATVDQVARAQGTRPTAASIMLASLERAGLVQRYRAHHLHKDVYSATARGLAAAGLKLPPVTRIPPQRRHALALLDLAHELCAETGGRWTTQRELAARWAGDADRAPLPVPHGLLLLPDGRRVGVQLELSNRPRHRVLEFVAVHRAAGVCDELWYVVAPEWLGRYRERLRDLDGVRVRAWQPPDRLGGPRGFRADRAARPGRGAAAAGSRVGVGR